MDTGTPVTGYHWCSVPAALQDDEALLTAVVEEHRLLYARCFRDDLEVNHQLPIMTHAFRRLGRWRVFLLLTPWMLARLFVPDEPPDIEVPDDWRAQTRKGLPYAVIGPTFELDLLTGKQKAHLNYSTSIGHYLLHPLILSMDRFQTPDEVFRAWNEVIAARNENLKKMQKQNPQHEEISRREFFSGMLRR
jgi:hypothetical protein